jgi:hypothetical protein
MRRLLLPLALVALLAGCSGLSREDRVRAKLIDAGVQPALAGCMAGRLVRKLDDSELRDLARVAKLPREHAGGMSVDEIGDRLKALDNPHIVSVVTRTGLGCAIAG